MSNLSEILEICLNEIENGADVDSVLFRYPEYADELRPILEASVKAKDLAVPVPPSDVVRRNRAKVLQHAAQMREAKARSSRRMWSVPLRRALVTLVVIGILFISTRLVSAASTTVPGDNLYPVKRTWEDVLILFTFNTQSRAALEVEHENERLTELTEVFAQGRSVEVDFSGLVTRQNGNVWLVSGIPVAVSAQTELPSQPIAVGDAIHVEGATQQDGAVLAREIKLLPAGMPLPTLNDDDSFEVEEEHSGDLNQVSEDHSGKGSEGESPSLEATQTSGQESNSDTSAEVEPNDQSLHGTVESITGDILVVDGQIMNVSSAEIQGTPKVGSSVNVEGYTDANGLFIVTRIEFESNVSNDSSGSGSGSDNGGSTSGGDNSGGGSSDDGGGDHSGPGDGGSD
jgi:uncharacterized membrane protein YgcG